MTFPGGSQSYQYDALMRLDHLSAPDAGLNYAYTYDHVNNILTKQTEHGNYGYGYDDVYRLTSADNPIQDDDAYTYDNVGNRKTASGVTGTIAHNANNELTVYGDISYDYDANGNMVRKSAGSVAVNYIYNVQHRLILVEDELSGLVIAEYSYDPFGRRLWKEVDETRTYFFYSDEGLVAEYDETGNELRSYGYQPDSTWTTDPLWLKEGAEYYWYQNDHLGTPQKLIDMNGTVVWSAQYTAFGNAQVQVETVTNNLRFPGQYEDVETGLHYNWFRYDDPNVGRYLQRDPVGFGGGDFNLYAYVGNNPVDWNDPSGLFAGEAVLTAACAAAPEACGAALGVGIVATYLTCWTMGICPDVGRLFPESTFTPPDYPVYPVPTPGSVCDMSPSVSSPTTIPDAIPTAVPLPPLLMKGERNWGKRRGDDWLWELSPEELRELEKTSPDSAIRKRARKIRKMKEKKRGKPTN